MEQIAVKKATVEADLSKVEPAVKDAQLAVRGIQKPQLVEVFFCEASNFRVKFR